MAPSQQHSPATPPSLPKRSFPSFSVRRPSTSSVTSPSIQSRASFSSTSTATAVAASPTPLNYPHNIPNIGQNGSPAGSGISSFRTLRNLLPFGPPKQPSGVPSTPSRSPFAGFGSMRRSVTINREKERERERKTSLSNDTYMPIISIEREPSHIRDDPPLRRSISLPRLEVSLDKHDEDTVGQKQDETVILPSIPILRTPSPGPPLLAELSTIIEVDNSGVSRYVPLLTPSTESSHSLSPPNSPICDDPEEHTIKRPLSLHPTTPLMTASTPLTPSTPAQPSSSSSSGAGIPAAHDAEDLELSTSHLVSQVKDAMARNSWTGDDKAVILDADASFLHTGSSSSEEDADGDGGDDNASLLAVLDARVGSVSSLCSTLEAVSDDISHMNNSLSSVVNPNHLHAAEDATLDLGSLDPDLRVAISGSTSRQTNTSRNTVSPSSTAHLSTLSSKTTPPSPSEPLQQPLPRAITTCFVPPELTSAPVQIPVPKPQLPAGGIPQSKRRVASSFLPRLRPTPRSTTSSATNSPSPHKISFDSVPTRRSISATADPRTPEQVQTTPKSPGVPSSAQWAPSPSASNPSTTKSQSPVSAEFGVVFAGRTVAGPEEGQDTREVLPVPVVTSTPMKPKAKKGLEGHTRKSSVPIASWRQKERLEEANCSRDERERGAQVLQSKVGPEVRILEASTEITPDVLGNDSSERWGSEKGNERRLSADTWSPGSLHRQGEESPIFGPNSHHDQERLGAIRGEGPRVLGSPFHTPGGRDEGNGWLGDGGRMGDALRPGLYSSPSHSPSPSPAVPPSSLYPSPNPSAQYINGTSTASPTPMETMLNSTPSSRLSSQSCIPNFITPNSRSDREMDGEGSPVMIEDSGNLSGRPSRRAPVPLKLFWGNVGSSGGEDKVERQPSPLRSVMRADRSGGGEEGEDGDGIRSGGRNDKAERRMQPERDARYSVEESTASGSGSVRPSMDSSRPSLDSYVSSVSAGVSMRRSPEPRYQRHSTELTRNHASENQPSRPPTSFRERDELGLRSRKRSMSMRENNDDEIGLGVANGSAVYGSGTKLSARERLARARQGDPGARARPWSSLSMRSGRTENLGSKSELSVSKSTRRIVRGTGLLDDEREQSPVLDGIERSVSERAGEREKERERDYRERSGSASALLGIGTLGRYASLRSTSEYNFGGSASAVNLSIQHQTPHHPTTHTRSTSRMAFSESSGSGVSGHGRRGSGAFSVANSGLTDSPTFTISTTASGSRETTRSASTGATSVSISSLTQAGVREEIRELKEKHSVETGALLSALSDSQRTCRVLREENGELRERFADVERENEKLRRILGEVEVEVERLRSSQERGKEWERERNWERERVRRRGGLGAGIGPSVSSRKEQITPLARQRDSVPGSRITPLASKWQRGDEQDLDRDERYEDKDRTALKSKMGLREQQHTLREEELDVRAAMENRNEDATASTSTLGVNRRRLSTSSSIFPALPPNMIMLLHDETASLPDSNRSSADLFSLNGFKTAASPLPIQGRQVVDNSMSSHMSASPTENISLVTGSPGSLYLKPEHEVLLGDMESLDLGRGERSEVEVWSD